MIYEQFQVTGTDDSVENYTDLFTIALRNDDIQEFDSKWDGMLLSMTKIPHDDILEGLYKLRIRESEKLRTVLELYDLETHQKKLGPDYHRLKAMVKRSIEQEIRNKNFGARSGNFEKNAVVKNQVPLELGWEKVSNWKCLFVHRKQGLCLSVYVEAGRKQSMAPMWKKLMKLVDVGEPTSFLDHVYLGCAQRECNHY